MYIYVLCFLCLLLLCFFFQAEDGIRDLVRSRGLGDVYKRQVDGRTVEIGGDVITAVDGEPVSSFDDILLYIAFKAEPGQTIKLTVIRDGAQQEVDVTLEPRPQTVN